MKRLIALLLVLMLAVFSASCSDDAKSDKAGTESGQKTEQQKENSSKTSSDKEDDAKAQKDANDDSSGSGQGSSNASGSSDSSSSSSSDSKNSCTISITCHKLVGNSKVDAATKKIVPSSGVILKSTKIKLQSNDTVYTVLKRAARKYDIIIVSDGSEYIRGIAGIFEKAAKGTSGWKYSVNGKDPSVSCGACSVSAGDVIEWRYVLTYKDVR